MWGRSKKVAIAGQLAGSPDRQEDFEVALKDIEHEILGDPSKPSKSSPADAPEPPELALGVAGALEKRYARLVFLMHTRLREYEDRSQWARRAHEQWQQHKVELEGKVDDMTLKNRDLRVRLTDAVSAANGAATAAAAAAGSRYHVINTRITRRSLRERVQQIGGMDFGSLDHDVSALDQDIGEISNVVAKGGRFGSINASMRTTFDRFMPLTRDIRFIHSHYGRSCGHFFSFLRFMLFLSFVVVLCNLPLLIWRLLSGRASALPGGKCSSSLLPLPCAVYFSGFNGRDDNGERDAWLSARYIFSMLLSAVLLLCLTLARLELWDAYSQAEALSEELQPRPWSKLVLGCWDFRLRNEEERRNFAMSLANRLQSLDHSTQAAETKAGRTRMERALLFLKRVVGLLLNLGCIAGGGGLITLAMVHKSELSNALGTYLQNLGMGGVGTAVGNLAPNLVVSGVGFILPPITRLIISYEDWRPSMQTAQGLWRLYLGKVLSLGFVLGLNIEVLMGTALFSSTVLVQHDSGITPCVEDEASGNLSSLVVTELLSVCLKPISGFAFAYVRHSTCRRDTFLRDEDEFQKPQFDIATFSVDIIYFQCLLWTSTLMVPVIAVFAPFVLVLHFKWLKFALMRLYSRSFLAESSFVSVMGMWLLASACACYALLAYFLATKPLPHQPECGPFDDGVAPVSMLKRLDLPGTSAVRFAFDFFHSSPGLPLAAAVTAATVGILRWMGCLQAYRNAIRELQLASRRRTEALENELARVERLSDNLRRRLAYHEKAATSVLR